MLGAMLGAHSNGLCVPEMRFKFSALRRWEWDNTGVNTLSVLKWLQNHWRFKIWELDIDLCSVIPNEVTYREFIELIVKLYGEKAGKPTPKFWIDHTPVNIMYAWTIFNVFPDAKMVHIVRDGRAVAASVMPLDWGPNEIHRAAQFWVRGIAYGLAAESWDDGRVIRVIYEDLVKNTESTLKRLCYDLEIDYEDEMPKAMGFKVPMYSIGQHSLVGSKPDPARVNAWESQLTSRQIEIFESVAVDLLRYLGYAPKYAPKAKSMSLMEKLALDIREIYKQEVVNRFRSRRRRRGYLK